MLDMMLLSEGHESLLAKDAIFIVLPNASYAVLRVAQHRAHP
jgi:hypothetical protein